MTTFEELTKFENLPVLPLDKWRYFYEQGYKEGKKDKIFKYTKHFGYSSVQGIIFAPNKKKALELIKKNEYIMYALDNKVSSLDLNEITKLKSKIVDFSWEE